MTILIDILGQVLEQALQNDLPEIPYRYRRPRETAYEMGRRRPTEDECAVFLFPQVWSSSALGFPGIGGQAITSAYTVVITCDRAATAAVYFGGRLAYLVALGQDREGVACFRDDLAAQRLASVADARGRYPLMTAVAFGPTAADSRG